MKVEESNRIRARAFARRRALVAAGLLALLATAAAAQRQLSWRPLAVEARLDADGVLQVRERHTMVFTGDWNGGERTFRLGTDQSLELLSMARVDPGSGAEVPLAEGSLSRLDEYDWVSRRKLRWRSRLPSDPPFDSTVITYVIEYRLEGALRKVGDSYLLSHDFAFPDRIWPVEGFTLELTLDPIWSPASPLPVRHGPIDLAGGQSYVVEARLAFLGEGAPAGVRALPPVWLRLVPFAGAALAILFLASRFLARERRLGRFDPPPAPERIDTGWLEEHLFDLLPEEAGALWDRKVGPPEVAAILARWQAQGRIESEVVPRESRWKRDVLHLKLTADRDSFEGYEKRLMRKLFFGGRTETDTRAIRKHYASRGFDPAGTVRRSIEAQLGRRDRGWKVHKGLPGFGARVTMALFGAFFALMLLEAISRPLMTLQLALLLVPPVAILYLLLGLVFAHVYRGALEHLGLWALGFAVPAASFFVVMVVAGFFDRLLPGIDFAPQPGMAGTAALAVLAVAVWSSLLNWASSRERPAGLRRRQRLSAARRLFAAELARQQPELDDEWIPYLLALGLGPRVDRWWKRFGDELAPAPLPEARQLGTSTSGAGGGSWTGGGGAFGGAGATASWAAVAGSVAAGVAKPGSGGSGGGGGGGGGSFSGGGGGGGW